MNKNMHLYIIYIKKRIKPTTINKKKNSEKKTHGSIISFQNHHQPETHKIRHFFLFFGLV